MVAPESYMETGFIRGELTPFSEMNVSVATAALQYGLGVFGGMRLYKQDDGSLAVFRLSDHLRRFIEGAYILGFPIEFDVEQVERAVRGVISANKPEGDSYIRTFMYRSDINLGPVIEGDYDFTVYMRPLGNYFKTNGLRVQVSAWTRNADNALPARTKASGGYVNSAVASNTAHRSGYDDAILLDANGHVTEASVMNFFMVKNDTLITSFGTTDVLEGVTRRSVIDLARHLGISVVERDIDRTELYTADEIFFAGTAAQITWCESVDDRPVGRWRGGDMGPITKAIEGAFGDAVRGRTPEFQKWLFKVDV